MLLELRIKNFVLIEDLVLSFQKGLNILTGETGAGKSILIGAISGILGDKMTIDMIRTGNERAILEGTFDISALPQISNLLNESGIDIDDNTLCIRRELYISGKGRCFANATQIPVAKLKEIAEYLIDIHGQNEHQNIARVAKHRELLDSFGNHHELVQQIGDLYKELQNLRDSLDSSEMDEKEKARRTEYLQFALNEINNAHLSPNEEEELKEESNILSHAEKLFTETNKASTLLNEDAGILTNLKKIEKALSTIADIDPAIATNLESIRQALYSLEDCGNFLRSYTDNIDFSPERINEVEGRLSLIASLKKKYGDTIHDILLYAQKSEQELDSISNNEEKIEKLKEKYRAAVTAAKTVALDLSAQRNQTAQKLEDLVMRELEDLNMKGTRFKVEVEQQVSETGDIEHNSKRYELYPHGLDKIEFLLSANEGQNLQQLRKVASGGEMSRIMLALKKVILSQDIVDTLIFDEVDTGISGKTAEIVGKKLKALASQRQVLVITHLPQIAAMSDNHFTVHKESEQHATTTQVKNLSKKEKIDEIARMLAGETITDLSRQHAEEMIAMAEKISV